MKHARNMQSTARIDALTMFESHFGWKIPLGFPEMSPELRKGPTPGNNDCGRTTGTTAEAVFFSHQIRGIMGIMCDSEWSWGISSEDLWIVRLESARTAPPSRWEEPLHILWKELKDCSDDVRDRTEKIKKDFKAAHQIAVALSRSSNSSYSKSNSARPCKSFWA